MTFQVLKNQRGQIAVEAVLIGVLIVGLVISLSRFVKTQEFGKSLARSPWAMVSGMIETGVWRDQRDAKKLHPNLEVTRRLSIKGEVLDVE